MREKEPLQELSFYLAVVFIETPSKRKSIKTEHLSRKEAKDEKENKNQKGKKERTWITTLPKRWQDGWIQMNKKDRERKRGKEEENIYEIKVSSAQSFLIYFVIVLCHGFILIENLYMRLHFENEP